ncbi:MAG: hypothetical protein GTN70_06785 [Deltaproteobacteria bacterium]|nr:hypothetical protein [Deltaproteobacteria bacterium]
MKKKFLKSRLLVTSMLFAFILISCGGGGGGLMGDGEGGGGDSPPVTGNSPFVGNTSLAVITTQNAKEIAISAYQGGMFGDELYLPILSTSKTEENASMHTSSFPVIISSSINEILEKASFSNETTEQEDSFTPLYTEGPYTFSDPYSIGSITYTFSINETSFAYSGSIQYDNYHIGTNAYFDGSITIEGSMGSNYLMYSYTVSSDNFTFVFGSEVNTIMYFEYTTTITYDGYLATAYSYTCSYYWKDGTTGQVSWVDNYTMTETFILDSYGYPLGYNMTISGKFYHPVYGCVSITTIQPLGYDYYSLYPSSGIVLLTGAGNSSIRISAIGGSNFLLEVDSGGDGIYEYYEYVDWVQFY